MNSSQWKTKLELRFDKNGWDDYLYWQKYDKATLKRLNRIIEDTLRDPLSGLGKPEKLKENLSGFMSRRITQEHRLVYRVGDGFIEIAQCRGHYN